MVSTSQKISCPLARISSFFENCFPLIPIIWFPLAKNSSDQNTVSTRQNIGFQNPFPLVGMKDFVEKTLPLDGK